MGNNKDEHTPAKRRYPPFYEKVIPIALGIIALIVIALLLSSWAWHWACFRAWCTDTLPDFQKEALS
jgi:hypothetical protein